MFDRIRPSATRGLSIASPPSSERTSLLGSPLSQRLAKGCDGESSMASERNEQPRGPCHIAPPRDGLGCVREDESGYGTVSERSRTSRGEVSRWTSHELARSPFGEWARLTELVTGSQQPLREVAANQNHQQLATSFARGGCGALSTRVRTGSCGRLYGLSVASPLPDASTMA